MSGLSTKKSWRSISLNCAIGGKQRTTGGGPREFLWYRLLNRIKLHRDVFSVYSKVYTLYYSQNGKIERLHLKKAIFTQRNEWNNERTLVEHPMW